MERTDYDLETERLEVLERYGVLGTAPEPSFDRVVRVARQLLGVPIALVTLVDEDRQWFKARVGLELSETGRDVSFCDHAIRQDGVMVVRDAQKDPRFQDNPLVTGAPGIRFYAGAPLETLDGYKLGTLCVIDTTPRAEFSAEAEAVLTELAALVMDALELRRAAATAEARASGASERRLRRLVGQVPAVLWTTDRELHLTGSGGISLEAVGYTPDRITGTSLYKRFGVVGPAFPPLAAHLRALGGETARYDLEVAGRSFEVRVEPLRDESLGDEQGDVIGCFGAAFDVTEQRQDEATLRRVNGDFTRVLGSISDVVWSAEIEPTGRSVYRYFSPVVETLTGRPPEFFRARPEAWLEVVYPDDRAAYKRSTAKVAADSPQSSSEGEREYRVVHVAGVVRWVRERVRAETQVGGARRLYGVLSDITARKEAEHRGGPQSEFRRELLGVMETTLRGGSGAPFYERLLACAVGVIPGTEAGSLMLCDEHRRCTYVAAVGYDFERLRRTYLWESELARGERPGPQLICSYDANHTMAPEREALLYSAGSVADIKVSLSLPIELEDENVAYFSLDSSSTPAAFDDEAVEMARVFAQQIAVLLKRFKLEGALEYLAYHDPLTDLSNRHLFEKQLTRAVARSWDGGAPFAVILLDLDDFRFINDSRGHAFGDEVLKLLAARLGGALRGGDLLARWESDAFALLIADVTDESEAAVVAERLLEKIRQPLVFEDRAVRVRASLGIDLYPSGTERPEELLRHADIALYHAKAAGDSYKVFDEPMNQRVQVRLELEITESTAMADITESIKILGNLRDLGVSLAIDDFGTAYSSLAYLGQLPVHSLKIDQAFVKDLGRKGYTGNRAGGESIIGAVVALARSFGLTVVVEGVETEVQRRTILALGCDEAQGYLFAKPQPAAEVTELLRSQAEQARCADSSTIPTGTA